MTLLTIWSLTLEALGLILALLDTRWPDVISQLENWIYRTSTAIKKIFESARILLFGILAYFFEEYLGVAIIAIIVFLVTGGALLWGDVQSPDIARPSYGNPGPAMGPISSEQAIRMAFFVTMPLALLFILWIAASILSSMILLIFALISQIFKRFDKWAHGRPVSLIGLVIAIIGFWLQVYDAFRLP